MIGTSDGEQYGSELEHTLSNIDTPLDPMQTKPIDSPPLPRTRPPTAPTESTGALKQEGGYQGSQQGGIDRSSFQSELDKNPRLISKMASMVKGEVGFGKTPLEQQQIQLETAFNRAQARGHSLGQALLSVGEDPHRGYYARDTYSRPATASEIEAFKTNVLGPVMQGSDFSSKYGHGPLTGNASADVARHQFARGTPGFTYPGSVRESYFNEEKGRFAQNLKNLPRLPGGSASAPITPKSPQSGGDQIAGLHIDREHDIPLAASALHQNGEIYGVAVDKDAPKTDLGIEGFDPIQTVALHEATELPLMMDYIADGMSNIDAYHKAHDIATATETARVRAIARKNGQDPDQFLDKYKQYWRDVTAHASAKENPNRHPDAHTTTHGLDEGELNRSFKMAANIDQRKPITPEPGGSIGAGVPHGGGGKVPESIYSAAVKHPNGETYMGINHADAYLKMMEATGHEQIPDEAQGFITSKGRFVSRKEAQKIAEEAGQKTTDFGSKHGLLSEELDPSYEEPIVPLLRKYFGEP